MTTKELIYQKSIELFSKYGYSNLGMRDLAKHVGIRAASIYNHYVSKEQILLQIADELVEQMKLHVYPLFKQLKLAPREFFTNISLETNRFFETSKINQLTNILIPVQHTSEKLRTILHEEFIIKPRTAFTYYFDTLIKKGKMEPVNANLAARFYHSFFIYHFYEKYLTPTPKGFLTNNEDLFKSHINLFMDYFKIT